MIRQHKQRLLTDNEAYLILNLLRSTNFSRKKICEIIGKEISNNTLSNIRYGLSYREIYLEFIEDCKRFEIEYEALRNPR